LDGFDADEALLRRTLDHLPIGLALLTPDGQVVGTNRMFAETLGYPAEEWEHRSYRDLTHPDDSDENAKIFSDLLTGQRPFYRGIRRLVTSDGGILSADISVSVLREDGAVRLLLAQVLDVSELKDNLDQVSAANLRLARERRTLGAVFDTVDVGLLLIDEQGRFERMNRRLVDTMAIPYPHGHAGRAGQQGMVFRKDGVTAMTRDEIPSYRASKGEEFDDLLMWIGNDPATRRAYSVSARNVRGREGRMAGAALAYKDVTDLIEALQAKEDFVASASHELRTPLTSILGYLELMADRDDLPHGVATQLFVVERNAQRLRSLVADLLVAAEARDGALDLNRTDTDLVMVVREAVEAARPYAASCDVSLDTDLPTRLATLVDAQRIRQVVDNLVSNAIKYNNSGGRATIALREAGGHIELVVADTGMGIDPADLERLFTRFFRGQEARSRSAPGTGLGLTICRDIARAHGGDVTVASEAGSGTTFTVTVPHITG
jgi:two-component system phosphate regulon sensor histidine kinase PhoR